MLPELFFFCFVLAYSGGAFEVVEFPTLDACRSQQAVMARDAFTGRFGIGGERGVSECYAISRHGERLALHSRGV